jgi:hypothetical protein
MSLDQKLTICRKAENNQREDELLRAQDEDPVESHCDGCFVVGNETMVTRISSGTGDTRSKRPAFG